MPRASRGPSRGEAPCATAEITFRHCMSCNNMIRQTYDFGKGVCEATHASTRGYNRSNLDRAGMVGPRRQPTLSPAAATGRVAMEAAAPGMPDRVEATIGAISPNTVRRIYEHIWGDVHQDATIGLRDRTISAIAALTAVGGAETNLGL